MLSIRTAGAVVALLVSASACRTREESARTAGREALLVAARECSSDASDVDACRAALCRSRCAPYADSKLLTEACTTKCTGEGTCDSDRDCAGGLVCTMIAPRLRKCQPRSDADW